MVDFFTNDDNSFFNPFYLFITLYKLINAWDNYMPSSRCRGACQRCRENPRGIFADGHIQMVVHVMDANEEGEEREKVSEGTGRRAPHVGMGVWSNQKKPA